MNALTGKQRLFIEAYLQCFNGVEAARRAGYKGDYNTLCVTAHNNLRNHKLTAIIEERLDEFKLTTDQALALLAAQASFDPGPYLKIDKDGKTTLDIEALRDAGLTAAIKSITPMKDGVKYEFEPRQGAIDKILRAGGAYRDRVDITSGDEPIADVKSEILSALHSISQASAEKADN